MGALKSYTLELEYSIEVKKFVKYLLFVKLKGNLIPKVISFSFQKTSYRLSLLEICEVSFFKARLKSKIGYKPW